MGITVSYKKREPATLIHLTSLMDVLTILLVFMLLSYSQQSTRDLPQIVTLPTVRTHSGEPTGTHYKDSHSVVITRDSISVKDSTLYFTSPLRERSRIQKKLQSMLQTIWEHCSKRKQDCPLTVQGDRGIPFTVLDIFLTSAAKAGFHSIQLVAKRGGKEI